MRWVWRAKTLADWEGSGCVGPGCAEPGWAKAGSAANVAQSAIAARLLGRRDGLDGQRQPDRAGATPGAVGEDAGASPDEAEAGGAERREGFTLAQTYDEADAGADELQEAQPRQRDATSGPAEQHQRHR